MEKTTMIESERLDGMIDEFWQYCYATLRLHLELPEFPERLSHLIHGYAEKEIKQEKMFLAKSVDWSHLKGKPKKYAQDLIKLFDASTIGYVSVSNVLLEYVKLQNSFNAKEYELEVGKFALVDTMPLMKFVEVPNKDRCPICNRFPQDQQIYALLSGNPKTDSLFQTSHSKQVSRTMMRVCQYCFMAGWVDLPMTKIVKKKKNVNKERDYLFITTPLSRPRLERLLDLIVQHGNQSDQDVADTEESGRLDDENEHDLDPLTFDLCNEFNVELSDPLSVLGLSTRRLRELRGFVLQSSNQLQRTIVLRVPLERIVGEEKVSGAVRQELMKAVMYDFWQVTGGALHYGRVRSDAQFSIEGQVVDLDAMFRANRAYCIADRYARVGKYRHLNSSLFMLFLTHPRQAANRIFNAKKREKGGRYAPGNKKVKEIIHMVEEIENKEDWQFQMGLKIVKTLVDAGLTKRAKGFWKNKQEQYSGVELVKWIQRIKMIRDPNSIRAWGNSLINGYRRENGYGANTKIVESILALVEEIISTCEANNMSLIDFGRTIANMDYYLLFYYNQNQIEEKEN